MVVFPWSCMTGFLLNILKVITIIISLNSRFFLCIRILIEVPEWKFRWIIWVGQKFCNILIKWILIQQLRMLLPSLWRWRQRKANIAWYSPSATHRVFYGLKYDLGFGCFRDTINQFDHIRHKFPILSPLHTFLCASFKTYMEWSYAQRISASQYY